MDKFKEKIFLNNNKDTWNETYKIKRANLPWNLDYIPKWFKNNVKFITKDSKNIIDVGCGEGNYTRYVAKEGVNVLGVDFSKEAIKKAKLLVNEKNLKFKVMDALNLSKIFQKFDSVYEVSLFHHISPKDRKKYAKEIYKILNTNGKLLICCFSDKEPFFKGEKEFINPETNTITYPLSKKEIIESFSNYFQIIKIQRVDFGKFENRRRWLCFMKKKDKK